MILRMAEEKDLVQVAELEKVIFGKEAWSLNSFYEMMDPEDHCFLIAEEDGCVAGYLITWFICGEGSILNVATSPAYRRRGIAREMLAATIDIGREINTEVMMLEVRESNEPAISLYKSFGFTEVGMRKNYYDNPPENAVLMDLRLIPLE